MSSPIQITSDSTSDLSAELRERYRIATLPLGITLGNTLYSDGVDITPDDIYRHHDKTGELPKTNAPNIADYTDFFKGFLNQGKAVIHFTISAEMSSSFCNAKAAAEELSGVYVIDSRNLSTGVGLLMLAAAELAQNGMEAEAIVAEINRLIPCVDASFVIDSLEYLYKGGRCSALAMLGANLLKLKPCIEVKNGKMGVGKKYRGKYHEVLKQYIRERIGDGSELLTDRVFITHAGCDPKVAVGIVQDVKELGLFKEIFLTRAGCTISSHCGANTLGILFIRKSPIE